MEIFEVQEGSFLLTPFLTSHVRDTVTERLPYPSLRTPTSHVFIGRMGYCCAFGALGSFLKVIWGDVLQCGWTVGCHFRLIRPARPPNPRPVVPVLSYFYLTFLKYSRGKSGIEDEAQLSGFSFCLDFCLETPPLGSKLKIYFISSRVLK